MRIERLLGTMLLRNHQSGEAIGIWRSLLAAHPDDEELFEDVIELHLEEGLFEQAVALSESLIAKTKDPFAAVTRRLRLGDILDRSGQRKKAIEVYSSTLEQAGNDTWLEREILAQIERLYRREDNLAGLKEQYVALLHSYSKRIALQRRRCRLLVEMGENDAAVAEYRKILELTPGDRGNREEFIDILSQIGHHDTAVEELKTLCQQNPKDAELRVRLAKALQQAKQTDRAIEAVDEYLAASDGSEYAYLRAARLVEQFGDEARSAEAYRRMSEKFADSPSAREAYAAYLYAHNHKEKAVEIWKRMAETADLSQTLNVPRALTARGENAVVLELLTSREKEFGNDLLFLGQLVGAALQQKKYEEAVPWANRRVALSQTATELETAVAQAVTATGARPGQEAKAGAEPGQTPVVIAQRKRERRTKTPLLPPPPRGTSEQRKAGVPFLGNGLGCFTGRGLFAQVGGLEGSRLTPKASRRVVAFVLRPVGMVDK